jgi:hypothetical protein
MKKSRTSSMGVFLCILGGAGLIGSLTVRSFGFGNCVEQAPCVGDPPPGMYCDVVYPDNGSQPQTNGITASGDACAYVYTSNGQGASCGAAVPLDPTTSCD